MNLKEFKNPDALYRNAPFWSWNDRLNADELKRQMDEMIEKGWGSSFMHSRVGLVTGYLSDEWMELTRECVKHAKETHTYVWLYDEDKWPSGFAGGLVPEKSREFRSRALVLLKKEQLTEDDTVVKEVEVAAEKQLICKRVAPLGNLWFNGASYVDLMNPEAVQEFIHCTHERYKEECGDSFGKEIPGVFTDEPCYLMKGHYSVPVVPWSDYLPDFFRKIKGYDVESCLEQLFFDIGDYQKVRYDFYDSATRLFLESFTKQYYNWCKENNLKLTGHFMAEDSLVYQMQWIGAAMPHYEYMQWPGIDKLGRHIKQHVTIKQLSSAAEQLGKERTLSEVFGCIGQQSSFFQRKWITDWQAVLGVSFVNSHLALYSMRGERKRDYPANLFLQQPWWDDERKFADYTARLCYGVSQGKREVDILVLHPIASVWSEYSPLHAGDGTMNRDFAIEKGNYDEPFDKLSLELIINKLDFHYGDEIIMENNARVEDGKLIIGQHAYSTVVIPPMLTLRENTLRLLKEFASAAGAEKVIFVNQMPARVEGTEKSLDMPKGVRKAGSIAETIKILENLYSERVRIKDPMTGQNAASVICQQRSLESGKIILFANTDEKREVTTSISIPGDKRPVILDLMSGELYEVPVTMDNGRVIIDCKFYPAGSLLLYFPDNKVDVGPAPVYLDSGVGFTNDFKTTAVIKSWDVRLCEENALPLNDATVYSNGRKVLENQPVSKAWHEFFYKLDNGTAFKAEYSFDVLNVPEGDIFAAVEMAENLDRITINGKEVKSLRNAGENMVFDAAKCWKDISFTRVPLTGLVVKGHNVLVIEGKKINNVTGPGFHERLKDFKNHRPTELEAVYIVGHFNVVNEAGVRFLIDGNRSKPCSFDLTKSGYPFYAGKAAFTTTLAYSDISDRVFIKLGDVEAASIQLFVNGQYVDVRYHKPYLYEITDFLTVGENEIKFVAATTLFNLLGPNRIKNIEQTEFVGPRTFIDFKNSKEEYTLLPFGIGSAVVLER